MGDRKGKGEGNRLPVPFLGCAVKGLFLPGLEFISTTNAWEQGKGATSRGDIK